MKMRSAVLTGVTGLMLNIGLVSAVDAQPYRYRNNAVQGRYAMSADREARQMVRQAYREILRREPDRSGLRQYMDAMVNRGWSYADVRRSLLESDEYAQRFGYSRSNWRGYR
jgi:hypothetical protein